MIDAILLAEEDSLWRHLLAATLETDVHKMSELERVNEEVIDYAFDPVGTHNQICLSCERKRM